MRIIAIANQKGGVGKTTVALNLAACLALAGRAVLAMDLDPQGNLAQGLGVERPAMPKSLEGWPLTDALLGCGPMDLAITSTTVTGLKVAASDGAMMETVEARLAERMDGQEALARALTQGQGHGPATMIWTDRVGRDHTGFDYAVLDCRPGLGQLTVGALYAAHLVLAPVEAARYALEGLADLNAAHCATPSGQGNRRLKILVNKHDPRLAVTAWLEQQLGDYQRMRMQTAIRRNEAINQAAVAQEPVARYSPRSNGAKDFAALAREVEALPWD